jgi:hypothetical protein
LGYGPSAAAAPFRVERALPVIDLRRHHEAARAIRFQSLLEVLQSGDVSDDERIFIEDELFKQGHLEEFER